MENCPCNTLFRQLFNAQATVIMWIVVMNFIEADCRLHPHCGKRHILKRNIWKRICNWNIFAELIKLLPDAHQGGGRTHPLPSNWKVYLNRSFALKIPHKEKVWNYIKHPESGFISTVLHSSYILPGLLCNRVVCGLLIEIRMTWNTQLLQMLRPFCLHMSFRGAFMFSWFAVIL